MRIDILTLFTEMCEKVVNESIIGRAIKKGAIEIYCHNIRDYTLDKQKRVDDALYGGGAGMLMQADPIYRCYEAVSGQMQEKPYVIYMSPQGNVLTQKKAVALSQKKAMIVLCGHYEGIDERIIEEIVDEEISIGDFVMTGGELPALVLIDTVCRLCPGVLSADECFQNESHFDGLLEYPQYTRPYEWHGKKVPDILLSGHHAKIEEWRRQQSIKRTLEKRPDLIEKAPLNEKERDFVKNLIKEKA